MRCAGRGIAQCFALVGALIGCVVVCVSGCLGTREAYDSIEWPVLFLIALAPLLALPVIIKTVPEEETAGSSLNVFGLFLVDAGNWVYILSMTIFPAGFALMYAPLVSTAVRRIPAENSGIAIGFYNLTINRRFRSASRTP